MVTKKILINIFNTFLIKLKESEVFDVSTYYRSIIIASTNLEVKTEDVYEHYKKLKTITTD